MCLSNVDLLSEDPRVSFADQLGKKLATLRLFYISKTLLETSLERRKTVLKNRQVLLWRCYVLTTEMFQLCLGYFLFTPEMFVMNNLILEPARINFPKGRNNYSNII